MYIQNNIEAQRFEYNENGETAYLEYKFYRKKDIAFVHTVVPETLKGKGVASALATAAFAHAADIKKLVMVFCPFVGRFVKNNPEYRKQLNPEYLR